jgi:Ankyrin repeats (3 copies)
LSLPLYIAASRQVPVEVVKYLAEAHPAALVTKGGRDGRLPLHLAARHATQLEVVRYLAKRSPQALDEATPDGWLPLHYAARYASWKGVVQILAAKSPRALYARTSKGSLPVDLARKQPYPDVAAWLESAMILHPEPPQPQTTPLVSSMAAGNVRISDDNNNNNAKKTLSGDAARITSGPAELSASSHRLAASRTPHEEVVSIAQLLQRVQDLDPHCFDGLEEHVTGVLLVLGHRGSSTEAAAAAALRGLWQIVPPLSQDVADDLARAAVGMREYRAGLALSRSTRALLDDSDLGLLTREEPGQAAASLGWSDQAHRELVEDLTRRVDRLEAHLSISQLGESIDL